MKIEVIENVLKANDAVAQENRRRLNDYRVLGVNLMSAPGSGKTSLLEATIPMLDKGFNSAVLVGDLQTTRDARRLERLASQTIQINTGRGCHLTATEISQGLDRLDLSALSFLFIENVGNMVCPTAYDLGEDVRVALLSAPEGDDKVGKYPVLFQPADAILLTKVDLLSVLDFDVERVLEDLKRINTRAPFIQTSIKTGEKIDVWVEWLLNSRDEQFQRQRKDVSVIGEDGKKSQNLTS
jgi:hydrogenase nickel incorporation protein HypB